MADSANTQEKNTGDLMNKPDATGLKRIGNAAIYSFQGLKAAWTHEEAFRLELMLAAGLVPLACWLGQTGLERAALLIPLFLVVIAELINSALEAIVDRISHDHHPLSGQAKDIGSAIVFIALIQVPIIWGLIAYQRVFPSA